jgi:hypothetical protein
MLEDNIRLVEEGQDPLNTFRDPEQNQFLALETEDYGPLINYKSGYLQHNNAGPNNTAIDVLDAFLVKTAAAWKANGFADPAYQNL